MIVFFQRPKKKVYTLTPVFNTPNANPQPAGIHQFGKGVDGALLAVSFSPVKLFGSLTGSATFTASIPAQQVLFSQNSSDLFYVSYQQPNVFSSPAYPVGILTAAIDTSVIAIGGSGFSTNTLVLTASGGTTPVLGPNWSTGALFMISAS